MEGQKSRAWHYETKQWKNEITLSGSSAQSFDYKWIDDFIFESAK